MIAKRLVSAMNASSSDTALSDDGLYKIKQKISANKSQRKIKKIMKEKEKANPNTSSNRPSSSIDETVSKYAHPVQYKISQFKKRVKGKIEDVGAEIKKKSMIRI